MKLYSGPLSLFTAKVRIALAEKGLPYERVEVGWSLADRYLPHHPDVAAQNPKAEVPVLVDGDVAIYDSTQIFEYLEDRHPEPALYPNGPAERARCRRLEAAADEILFPAVWDLIEEAFYPAADGTRNESRLEEARGRVRAQHESLDKELSGREYLCDSFGVADIATFIFCSAAGNLGSPPGDAHPNLLRWSERVGARPSVRQEVDEMNAFLAKTLAAAGPD